MNFEVRILLQNMKLFLRVLTGVFSIIFVLTIMWKINPLMAQMTAPVIGIAIFYITRNIEQINS